MDSIWIWSLTLQPSDTSYSGLCLWVPICKKKWTEMPQSCQEGLPWWWMCRPGTQYTLATYWLMRKVLNDRRQGRTGSTRARKTLKLDDRALKHIRNKTASETKTELKGTQKQTNNGKRGWKRKKLYRVSKKEKKARQEGLQESYSLKKKIAKEIQDNCKRCHWEENLITEWFRC